MGPLLLLLVLLVPKVVSKLGRAIPMEVTVVATAMAEEDMAARAKTKNRGQMVVLSNLGSVARQVGPPRGRWAVVVVAAVAVAVVVVADVAAMDPGPMDMHLQMLPRGQVAYRLGSSRKVTAPRQDRLVVRLHHGERRSTLSHLLHLQALLLPHGLLVRLGPPPE